MRSLFTVYVNPSGLCELLGVAWEQVNANPTATVYVQSSGQLVGIVIQAPSVSYTGPPAAPHCK